MQLLTPDEKQQIEQVRTEQLRLFYGYCRVHFLGGSFCNYSLFYQSLSRAVKYKRHEAPDKIVWSGGRLYLGSQFIANKFVDTTWLFEDLLSAIEQLRGMCLEESE